MINKKCQNLTESVKCLVKQTQVREVGQVMELTNPNSFLKIKVYEDLKNSLLKSHYVYQNTVKKYDFQHSTYSYGGTYKKQIA